MATMTDRRGLDAQLSAPWAALQPSRASRAAAPDAMDAAQVSAVMSTLTEPSHTIPNHNQWMLYSFESSMVQLISPAGSRVHVFSKDHGSANLHSSLTPA